MAGESVSEFNKRIHAEGRTAEWQEAVLRRMDEHDCTRKAAVAHLRPLFGPVQAAKPATAKALLPSGTIKFSDEAPSYYEALRWVLEALGRRSAHEDVQPEEAPGSTAWGLFCWAWAEPKEFYKLWAVESRKQRDAELDRESSARYLQHSVLEMENMLREIGDGGVHPCGRVGQSGCGSESGPPGGSSPRNPEGGGGGGDHT